MTLNQFQYLYNGLTFGEATNFGVVKADWDLPPVSVNSQARTRLDGFYPGLDLAQIRPITFDFAVTNTAGSGTQYYTDRETFRTTFVLQPTTPQPLSIQIPDFALPRRFYCRPRKVATPEDNVSSTAQSSWSVQLDADDPLLYDDTATSVGAAGSISVPNAGDYPAGAGTTAGIVVLTVSSACTLTSSNGGSLIFTGSGPWTVDLGTHVITGGNGYSDLTQPASFFLIAPGGVTVSVSAGTVSAVTRSAWLP